MEATELGKKIEQLALDHGYSCVGYTTADKLRPTEDVRSMCAAGRCKSYDHSWACPPACGSVEEFAEKIATYKECVVFQTVGDLEDEFDFETMMETSEDHADRMPDFADDVRELVPNCMVLAAGTCNLCKECAYPDEPCRFPEKRFTSMEASGLVVSDTCIAADIPYNHGSDHIAYVSCVLF